MNNTHDVPPPLRVSGLLRDSRQRVLRSLRAPPGIAHYGVRGTRYRLTGTGTGATT
jgi:hypothetical protein